MIDSALLNGENLRELYWDKKLNLEEISIITKKSVPTISGYMKRYGIPVTRLRQHSMALNCQNCHKQFRCKPSQLRRHQGSGKYCSVKCRSLSSEYRTNISKRMTGHKLSEEGRYRIILALTGRPSPLKGVKTGRLAWNSGKKGVMPVPWNKGLKGWIVPWNKGKAFPQIAGSNNYRWKGGLDHYYGPNWRLQRQRVLIRDKVCRLCGKTPADNGRNLDVHHIIPFVEFHGDYLSANDLKNLIAICMSCHSKTEHRREKSPTTYPLDKSKMLKRYG